MEGIDNCFGMFYETFYEKSILPTVSVSTSGSIGDKPTILISNKTKQNKPTNNNQKTTAQRLSPVSPAAVTVTTADDVRVKTRMVTAAATGIHGVCPGQLLC